MESLKPLGRLNNTLKLIKLYIINRKRVISSTVFISNIFFFKVLTVSRSFTMPNLRKIKFATDFNGSLGYLCIEITHLLADDCCLTIQNSSITTNWFQDRSKA